MALVLADRVKDTTTTTSTGTITLSGTAPIGFQNFSVIGDGNTTYYTIAHQAANEWEVGIGTYTSSGTTLSRTTVLASSNSGSLVVFSAGTKDVFVTYPAERSVNLSSAALTSGRIPYATTDGLLTNSANLTFDGSTLTTTGNVGIGTALTQVNLYNTRNISGNINSFGNYLLATIQSDVTNAAYGYRSNISTQAAAFTLTSLSHFYAGEGTIGATSAVTAQYGFFVSSAFTGATTNTGFYGQIASGTGRYNLYMGGTADNYMAGNLGIGSTSLTARRLVVAGSMTGATGAYGLFVAPTVQPDVTANAFINSSQAGTAANGGTPYTISNIYVCNASQGTFNADSTVTNQYGFNVTSSLTGATNNYGFYGNIASGTGRYNLYMSGTANNYMAGALGIGTTSVTATKIGIGGSLTGATTSYGVLINPTVQPDVTSAVYLSRAQMSTAANGGTPYTIAGHYCYYATQSTYNADSTVTTQVGFAVPSAFTGATNNYAFFGQLASGTGRYNLYMGGTAQNYIAGNVGIGASIPATKLEIAGSNNSTWSATTTSISGTTMTIAGTVTGTIAIGDLVFGTGVQPYTRITAGSALSWTVSVYQTVASATLVGGATYGDTLIRITETDTSVAAGQPTGGLQFYTSDSSTPTAGVGAYVAAISEAVTPDTSLVFGTRDNAGGGIDANERMRIDSSGNVGIGTSSPSYPLTVVSNSSAVGLAVYGRSSDSLSGAYWFSNTGANTYGTILASATEYRITSTPAAAVQTFYTNATERMRITSAGGVSFGATGTAYGTSGQVLTSAGNAPPTWATVSSSPIPTVDVKTTGTSATWTIPTGITKVRITVVAGGGAGSVGTAGRGGGGAGGGGTAIKVLTVVAGTLTYTVGGAGASSQVASGTNNTITTVSATAGSDGSGESGAAGGIGSNGDLNIGGSGGSAAVIQADQAPQGGTGGSSYLGGGGYTTNNGPSGNAGRQYGGGGSGGCGTSGGAGAAGVIIFEY